MVGSTADDQTAKGPLQRPCLELGPDARLLSALLQKGRAPYEDLAEWGGMSRQTAWRRVQALHGDTIWGYAAVVDFARLGWRQFVISFPVAPDADAASHCRAIAAPRVAEGTLRVTQALLVRGASWRLVVQVAAKHRLALEVFVQELRGRFPGRSSAWQVDEVEYVGVQAGFQNPSGGGWPVAPATHGRAAADGSFQVPIGAQG